MSLYLIDGTANIYRSFFAVQGLRNSKGFPTNAIYGFLTSLYKIIKDDKAQAIAVAFDRAEPTQRHKLYPLYKAHRPHPPDDLIQQIKPIRDLIEALGIKIFSLSGVEADDILATIAKRVASEGFSVHIVSNDKDLLQVVGHNISIYDPVKNVVLDEQHVIQRFGLPPHRVPEVMALTGDASDNIPGVKGIGEKTAVELLRQFSSIDELINNPARIRNNRIRRLIQDNIDNIKLSKQLVTIDTEVPMTIDVEDLFSMRRPNHNRLRELFTEYEFYSLLKLIPEDEVLNDVSSSIELITDTDAIRLFAASPHVSLMVSMDGGSPLLDPPKAIAIAFNEKTGCYVKLKSDDELARNKDILLALLGNTETPKIGHDVKSALHALSRIDINVEGYIYDTMIASYLLNPNRQEHQLSNMFTEYLSYNQTPSDDPAYVLGEEAVLNVRAKEAIFDRLAKAGLMGLYNELEMPLIYVLREVEENGINIDMGLIRDLSGQIETEMSSTEKRIYLLAGDTFNINSPKQLSEVLFTRLKLQPLRKIKTGYSTDNAVLEALAAKHVLPAEIIHYRGLAKLKNTYLDTLGSYINPRTGRLHTTFNQTSTATGRLSSVEPNLQNIPIKGYWGERIRGAFVAAPGSCLLSADYSQIELRVLAHLSADASLIEAFNRGEDIHDRTAREVFNVQNGVVTSDMRRIAKTISFGIIYGMSPHGLSEAVKITQQEAKRYIDAFFKKHDGVSSFIAKTIEETRDRGYSTTIKGRIRPITDLNNSNRNPRMQAERLAINTPVQGSAADIIKIAMINVHNELHLRGLKSKMILQIHDELLLEVPEMELEEAKELVTTQMEKAIKLSVPLRVDVGVGQNWAQAKV
ncbi:MAG: DNA polymerase I [Nitrospirae bacterium]|nr:DNA polymerase I [Nitrospirota bacterium]